MEEVILKERQLKEEMVQLINNAGLPAFIIIPILKELFEQVNILEQQQYELAKKKEKEKINKQKKRKS